MGDETRIQIISSGDIVTARQHGRTIAAKIGFSSSDQTVIATAISEIARNIIEHADSGEMLIKTIQNGLRKGVLIVAQDKGPGIPDIALAMQHGYSSGKGLGLGLPGSKRLMDDFDIESERGKGTIITMKKWLR